MSEQLLGRKPADALREETLRLVSKAKAAQIVPRLHIVLANADGGAKWYSNMLVTQSARVGIDAVLDDLGPSATATSIASRVAALAEDPEVHGILIQAPAPEGVRFSDIVQLIPPEKDVDGASPLSAGRLVVGESTFVPATAEAVVQLLDAYGVPLEGQDVVIVGRSNVVGKPLASLMLRRDATVTVAHSKSRELRLRASQADILVVAAGRPGLVDDTFVTRNSIVIDVGTTTDSAGHLVGDVTPGLEVKGMSPVPGGVGTVTTAVLLRNVALAANGLFSIN